MKMRTRHLLLPLLAPLGAFTIPSHAQVAPVSCAARSIATIEALANHDHDGARRYLDAVLQSNSQQMEPMWDAMIDSADDEKQLLANMPLHRFGRPDEVAAVAILLASDEATYITGSEFNIDGGILAGTATSPK